LRRVLLPARVPGANIPNVVELVEMKQMLAERVKTWTEEWRAQGLAEGRKLGLDQGLREGREQGLAKGLEKGMTEGRRQGEVQLLRTMLTRRFGTLPAQIEERLEGASEAELEAWAGRILDGAALDELF
jgi:flagellar biosynthesis/type III secretory pathway protein FliH